METPSGVREALDRLASEYKLGCGGLRIFARFEHGQLIAAKRSVFRVPATKVHLIPTEETSAVDRVLLETVARLLRLDRGATELVVEYLDRGEGPWLQWVDFSRVDL